MIFARALVIFAGLIVLFAAVAADHPLMAGIALVVVGGQVVDLLDRP